MASASARATVSLMSRAESLMGDAADAARMAELHWVESETGHEADTARTALGTYMEGQG